MQNGNQPLDMKKRNALIALANRQLTCLELGENTTHTHTQNGFM